MTNTFNKILSENWKIQSSKNILVNGAEISVDSAVSDNWIPAVVPSTVLGTLVSNDLVKDPFFGENLKDIDTAQFECPWWYITNFELSTKEADNYALLSFDGINHKANVWLNGFLIADSDSIDGAFRITAFDVSENIVAGNNILAIEVIPPVPGDFSIGYVDWNPSPPDGNMGVFRPVTLHLNAGIGIEDPFVQTEVNLETLKEADLSISAELVNYTDKPISGKLVGKIESVEFDQTVTIEANSKKTVEFSIKDYPQLKFNNPRLWWPIHLGDPNLYDLELEFRIDEVLSDASQTRFGIRKIEDYWLNEIHRGYNDS